MQYTITLDCQTYNLLARATISNGQESVTVFVGEEATFDNAKTISQFKGSNNLLARIKKHQANIEAGIERHLGQARQATAKFSGHFHLTETPTKHLNDTIQELVSHTNNRTIYFCFC